MTTLSAAMDLHTSPTDEGTNEDWVEETKKEHIFLRRSCGLCGFWLCKDEHILALVNDGFSASCGVYDAHNFDDSGYCDSPEGCPWRFCYRNCKKCRLAPESSTVHADCYKLFLRSTNYGAFEDKMRLLWVASGWRYPWRGALPLGARDSVNVVTGIERIAAACNLPQLLELPNEINDLIWEGSESSLLWRFSAVMDLIQTLESASLTPKDRELVAVPFSTVCFWERGSSPVLNQGQAPPYVRFTVDNMGLQKIERLDTKPKRLTYRSPVLGWVIEEANRFTDSLVQFQFGLGHVLLAPKITAKLDMWDTPTPPTEAFFYAGSCASEFRYRTVDLRGLSGITFLMTWNFGMILAVHAHTAAEPSAMETFYSPYNHTDRLCWAYVPLKDEIESFGARAAPWEWDIKSRCPAPMYFLRFKRIGEVILGIVRSEETEDWVIDTGPHLTLFHDLYYQGEASSIGFYSDEAKPVRELISHPPPERPPISFVRLSTAPLTNVATIRVFYWPDSSLCSGMLLAYNDGTERSLGECRLGVHRSELFTQPTCLCFSQSAYRIRGILYERYFVYASPRGSHNHVGDLDEPRVDSPWTCCPMKGSIWFWFSDKRTKLEITESSV